MPTYTAVTTKTLRARSSYRTDLAVILRDTTNSVWDTTTLNMCLDEALGLVQQYFPPVRTYEQTVVATNLQYQLPADCVRVLEVVRGNESQLNVAPLFIPVKYEVRRLTPLAGASGAEDLSLLLLVLLEDPDTSYKYWIRYVAAQQVWGSWSTIGSGVDTATTKDLNPASLGEGLALLAFWAAARVAALEWAAQLVESDGGRDYLGEAALATKKRDGLLSRLSRPRSIGVKNTFFG